MENETKAEIPLVDRMGRQLVTIDWSLGYAWSGKEPLKVGDAVRLPPNWLRPNGFVGEVTSLGSDWHGGFAEVIGRV